VVKVGIKFKLVVFFVRRRRVSSSRYLPFITFENKVLNIASNWTKDVTAILGVNLYL
jgi:hypothetical protein